MAPTEQAFDEANQHNDHVAIFAEIERATQLRHFGDLSASRKQLLESKSEIETVLDSDTTNIHLTQSLNHILALLSDIEFSERNHESSSKYAKAFCRKLTLVDKPYDSLMDDILLISNIIINSARAFPDLISKEQALAYRLTLNNVFNLACANPQGSHPKDSMLYMALFHSAWVEFGAECSFEHACEIIDQVLHSDARLVGIALRHNQLTFLDSIKKQQLSELLCNPLASSVDWRNKVFPYIEEINKRKAMSDEQFAQHPLANSSRSEKEEDRADSQAQKDIPTSSSFGGIRQIFNGKSTSSISRPTLTLSFMLVLGFAMLIVLPRYEQDESAIIRGNQTTQTILTGTPDATSSKLKNELDELKIPYETELKGASIVLRIKSIDTSKREVMIFLISNNFEIPRGGTMVIEIRKD